MKTDRELLELAAKAFWGAEIGDTCSVRWSEIDEAICYMHGDNQDHNGQDVELCWNPLEWNHDALQLAVKLRLHIGLESHTVSAWANDDFGNFMTERHADRGDEAGTRRAIVRAAAYIGERMP